MRGGELQSVDYSQHFIEISPGCHRIDHNELNQLVGPDEEHIAYCLIVSPLCAVLDRPKWSRAAFRIVSTH